jgi:tagatose 6-phosphate kinase
MIATVTLNASVDKLYLVEKNTLGTVMRVREVCNTAGGKGLNVSKVAALAGESVTATGFLGGFNGRCVARMLETAGIVPRFAETGAETRSCVNIRDISTGTHTEYLEPGAEVSAREIDEFKKLFSEALQISDVITISGSAPKGVPMPFYGDLVKLAKEAGKPVVVDASGEMLIGAVKAKPTLIKPNTDEIAQLLGGAPESQDEIIEAATRLHGAGIEYVAVSLGKRGSILACGEGVFIGETPDIPVVNTVGSGDSMVAGFAISICRGYSAAEMLRLATAIATANALEIQTGHISPKNVEKLLKEVNVIKLR